jgi:transcriptional regulator with XRE-family HTH domain
MRKSDHPQATIRAGSRVKALRDERGMTQGALAKRSDVSRATICALEGGHLDSVRMSTLGKLARVLGVPVLDLLSD